MVSVIVEVWEHTCYRCIASWQSRLERPKQCPYCKSHLWFKPRKKPGEPGARNKYGFDELEVGVEKAFPFIKRPDGTLDSDANASRARSLDQFMRRRGWEYSWHGVAGNLFITRRT